MSRVLLHGNLKEKFSPEYNLSVQSPAEAVRALCNMVPGFKDEFSKGSYYLYVDDQEHVNVDETNFTLAIPGTINIMPEVVGAKRGGLGKVLLGVAMIGLSVVTAGAAVPFITTLSGATNLTFMASATIHGLVTAAMMNVGIGLILGGATQLLSPKMKAGSAAEQEKSGILQGAEGTLANGSVVPLVYGEVLATGVPVSFEISDATSNYVTNNTGYNESVGFWETVGSNIRGELGLP